MILLSIIIILTIAILFYKKRRKKQKLKESLLPLFSERPTVTLEGNLELKKVKKTINY